jgi:hypothetical protein
VRPTFHERLAEEARHLVIGERPRGLEGGQREHHEIERGLAGRVPVEAAGERASAREPGREAAHDYGVGAVRRLIVHG